MIWEANIRLGTGEGVETITEEMTIHLGSREEEFQGESTKDHPGREKHKSTEALTPGTWEFVQRRG